MQSTCFSVCVYLWVVHITGICDVLHSVTWPWRTAEVSTQLAVSSPRVCLLDSMTFSQRAAACLAIAVFRRI